MVRYYFDIRNAGGHHRDEFGEEFDGFEDARAQAQALLPDIVREELPDGERHMVTCEVRNEAGRVVYRAEISFKGQDLRGHADAGSGPPSDGST